VAHALGAVIPSITEVAFAFAGGSVTESLLTAVCWAFLSRAVFMNKAFATLACRKLLVTCATSTALVRALLLQAFITTPVSTALTFSLAFVTQSMPRAVLGVTWLFMTCYACVAFITLAHTKIAFPLSAAVFMADALGAIFTSISHGALALSCLMIAASIAPTLPILGSSWTFLLLAL